MPAVSLLKLANRCPGSMQTSSLAFETSTPQIVFFTVTCLVHAIGTQATVRSCVTWRRSQSSPTVVAGGGTGDIATRFGRWPPAKALSRFHRTNSGRADTRGLLCDSEPTNNRSDSWRGPLTPTLSPQAGRGRNGAAAQPRIRFIQASNRSPKRRILNSQVAFVSKIGPCGGEGVSATQHNTATHIKFRCVAQN